MTRPLFVFDQAKSDANRLKHGIDFVEAQRLWLDVRLVYRMARSTTERRYRATGRIDGKHWTAVVTTRGDATRLISVRRARVEEVQSYEGE